jgi:hypothetical protein
VRPRAGSLLRQREATGFGVHDPCPGFRHYLAILPPLFRHQHQCAGGISGGTSRITSHVTLYKSIGYVWYSIPSMGIELRLFIDDSAKSIVDLFECGLLTRQQRAEFVRIKFGHRLVVGGLLDDCLTRGGNASYIKNV